MPRIEPRASGRETWLLPTALCALRNASQIDFFPDWFLPFFKKRLPTDAKFRIETWNFHIFWRKKCIHHVAVILRILPIRIRQLELLVFQFEFPALGLLVHEGRRRHLVARRHAGIRTGAVGHVGFGEGLKTECTFVIRIVCGGGLAFSRPY